MLWDRVSRRDTRPLLKTENPKETLRALLEKRYPVYAEAALTVISRDAPKEAVAEDVIRALATHETSHQAMHTQDSSE